MLHLPSRASKSISDSGEFAARYLVPSPSRPLGEPQHELWPPGLPLAHQARWSIIARHVVQGSNVGWAAEPAPRPMDPHLAFATLSVFLRVPLNDGVYACTYTIHCGSRSPPGVGDRMRTRVGTVKACRGKRSPALT